LNGAGARYLVGGYAVAFHAEPRYTKDLDVWVDPSADNAIRVFAALNNSVPRSVIYHPRAGSPG
jgi:hypothetical protein